MLLLIVFLPLIGAILAGFFSWFIGRKGAMLITTSFMAMTFVLAILAFIRYYTKNYFFFVIDAGSWITFGRIELNWTFLFDSLSIWMLLVVSFISLCVHLYSISYMSNDPHQGRFFSYLSLFTFFMLFLVTAGNFFQVFVGWEGVGLCSYLLIAFWYHRIAANKAALKAVFLNKIGDLGFLIAMIFIFYIFESLDFLIILKKIQFLNFSNIFLMGISVNIFFFICLFLFIAAIGKSAQIGLHTWLPDAMEGPTPVSALIHSATMVTAGVFLIIRSSFLFEQAPDILVFVTFIGAITAVFAASAALFQNDIKKIIAYSTCSQLGYMVFACGLSAYTVSFFHLVNHAFFKALLFLCAGSIIHALNDEQDIRKMGGLLNFLPLTYITMLIASLSLAGFPFLTGFYSKDFILEVASVSITAHGLFSYWLGLLTVCFTAFYSLRTLVLVFYVTPQGYKVNFQNIHEMTIHMALPMFTLAFGSICFGFFAKDLFIGLGTDFFRDSIFVFPEHSDKLIISEFVPFYIKNLPLFFTLLAIFLIFLVDYLLIQTVTLLKLNPFVQKFIIFFNKKWFFDLIYNEFFVIPFLRFCYHVSFKSLDKGFLEFFGPFGIQTLISYFSKIAVRLQNGSISDYLALFLIVTIGLISGLEIVIFFSTL